MDVFNRSFRRRMASLITPPSDGEQPTDVLVTVPSDACRTMDFHQATRDDRSRSPAHHQAMDAAGR